MPPHAYLVGGMQLFTHLWPLNFVTGCAIVVHPYFSYAETCEYRMYQLISLHPYDYLLKTSIKINVATDEGKQPK